MERDLIEPLDPEWLDPGPESPDDDPAATVDSILYRYDAGLPLTPEQTGWIAEGLRSWKATGGRGDLANHLGLRMPSQEAGRGANLMDRRARLKEDRDLLAAMLVLHVVFGLVLDDASDVASAWSEERRHGPVLARATMRDRWKHSRVVQDPILRAALVRHFEHPERRRAWLRAIPDHCRQHLAKLHEYRPARR